MQHADDDHAFVELGRVGPYKDRLQSINVEECLQLVCPCTPPKIPPGAVILESGKKRWPPWFSEPIPLPATLVRREREPSLLYVFTHPFVIADLNDDDLAVMHVDEVARLVNWLLDKNWKPHGDVYDAIVEGALRTTGRCSPDLVRHMTRIN